MKQLFEVGECVILQSVSSPELNGEYHVLDVIEYGDIYECRLSGLLVNFVPPNKTPFAYRLEEVISKVKSSAGLTIENPWHQTALRKKQQKGDMSFKELMSDLRSNLKTNIQERVS